MMVMTGMRGLMTLKTMPTSRISMCLGSCRAKA